MCQKNLSEHDLQYISEIKDCDNFQRSIDEMHIAFVHLSSHTFINRINPLLSSLKSFVALLVVAMGNTAFNAAIVWGVLSLVVQVQDTLKILCPRFKTCVILTRVQTASGMSTIMADTTDMLEDLGHTLEIIRILEMSFEENPSMGQELMEIFVEIICFWTRAIKFLRRNQYGTVAFSFLQANFGLTNV